jgi:tetratricopeptide (TPR) repeat protein
MAGCAGAPSTQGRVVRSGGRFFTVVAAGSVVLALVLAALDPKETVMSQALDLLLILTALVLHLVVHEAAHALTALATRMGVPEVELGSGPPLLRFRLGATTVKIGGFHSGATHLEPQSTRLLPARLALVTAAGPLSNLGLAAAAYLLLEPSLREPASFGNGLVVSGVMLGLFNLLPLRVRTPSGTVETDGRVLVSLLRAGPEVGEQLVAAGRLSAVQRRHVDGEEVPPEGRLGAVDSTDPVILGIEGTRRIFTGEHDEAVALLRRAVAGRQEEEAKANSLNNLAWALVLSRPEGWLEEADRASAEAIALRPRSEAMMSTRGCVLVDLGDLETARPLLQAALQGEVARQDQILLHSHLLRAEHGLGNLYGAREALLAMIDLDAAPDVVATHRQLLRTAEVDNALSNLVGADGLIRWPRPEEARGLARHVEEMRSALLAFVSDDLEDHRKEPVRLALGLTEQPAVG